jgi:TonB-linked SusC/RagA family outer membrane protein
MSKKLLFLMLLPFFTGYIWAQTITVTGTVVTSIDNIPIPGVTIIVNGTTNGTSTDIDGVYLIEVAPDAVLSFSYIGMLTVEIPVNNTTTINVEMNDLGEDLGEVIVVGYSTTNKKLISGSIGSVTGTEIEDNSVKTLDGVLQGKIAGLIISQNSGTPGGQNMIKLRGGSSINANNQPLVVIDGIPMITGSYSQIGYSGQEIDAISDLNPNDIESVSVLKDASSTAIYGARASNGVILITTKKGSYKKTNVKLNTFYGWQSMPAERLTDLMNAQQWNEYKGTDVQGIDTDWMKEILQIAPTSNNELSISSGTEKMAIYISGNYFLQDGTIKSTSYERYNGRINIDHKIFDFLTIGGNFSMSYSKNNRVEGDQTLYGPLPNALSIPAIYPVYNPDGTYNESGPYANPVAIINETINQAFTNRTNGNVYADFKLFKFLTFKTKWGVDFYNLREHEYDPITTAQGLKYNGLGIEGNTLARNMVSNNILQYSNLIESKNNIDVLLGYSFEKYSENNSYIEAIDFPNENLQYINSAATIRLASASSVDRGLNSFFGQFRYNFRYKYILTVTSRADGSSRFGTNNKYGYFPAASLAWRIGEERFLKNSTIINEFKLRLSSGYTGNDGIGEFRSYGLYSGGFNYNQQSGIAPIQIPNPDLRWESTFQNGIGLNLDLLESKISITADIYKNVTKNLLLDRPLPLSSGFYQISYNVGTLENKGLELVIKSDVVDKAFNWNISVNFSMNRNKVIKLYEGQPISDYGRGGNWVIEGEPIGVFYGYKCLGVDPSTGNLVYDDINNDGLITSEDISKIGDPNPDFTLDFTNRFTYKGFELSVFLHSVYGNDIFNGTNIYLESVSGEDNQTMDVVNRWRKPGDITDIPRAGDNLKSSRFIENGSFLRIKNVTLGYDFPKSLINKIKINALKLYVSAQNLYMFTSYSGMDPEVNYYSNDNIIMGTDFFTYPQSRTILVGLNITL